MKTGSTGRRGVWNTTAALLVLTVAAAGCGRPDDEAWLRCIAFTQSAETISVLEGDLNDGTSSTVDIELENGSLVVGTKAGTGILVNRVRVDYRMSGFSPPSADFPVNLYLSPPADGKATAGTLTAFPLASQSLKQWLVDAGVSASTVELTARVTFYGQTDAGAQIETEASLGIALTNIGGGTTPVIKPTVSVTTMVDGENATLIPGKFKVERSDQPPTTLTVVFTLTGLLTAGDDYEAIGSSVVIRANQKFAEISILPKSTGNTGNVIITLNDNNDSYAIDPSNDSATLQIL